MSSSVANSKIKMPHAVVTLLALVAITIIAVWQLSPPGLVPATAPVDEFSAERAIQHVHSMDIGPHWTGSPGNEQIRDYLIRQLQEIGWETEIQAAQVIAPEYQVGANIENVVTRLPGTEGEKAVLLIVHYDGVPTNTTAALR